MGKIGIVSERPALNSEQALRQALENHDAIVRMSKTWPVIIATPRGLIGKRGPGLVRR